MKLTACGMLFRKDSNSTTECNIIFNVLDKMYGKNRCNPCRGCSGFLLPAFGIKVRSCTKEGTFFENVRMSKSRKLCLNYLLLGACVGAGGACTGIGAGVGVGVT